MLSAGMVPYFEIDSNAPFSVALSRYYPAAGYIVSVGACAGTFNSAFADLYAMSRLMVVMSRCRLIPSFLVSSIGFACSGPSPAQFISCKQVLH